MSQRKTKAERKPVLLVPPPPEAFAEVIRGWEDALEAVGTANRNLRIREDLGSLQALRLATMQMDQAVQMLALVVPAAMAAERASITRRMAECPINVVEA